MQYKEHIFKQNPWLTNVDAIKKDPQLVDLNLEKFIWRNSEFLDFKFQAGVYLVTGMRQVGKTTHLKMLIKEKINPKNNHNFFYFNCDLLDVKKEIIEIVEFYLKEVADKNKKIYLILDEITAIKDGVLAIKYLIDSGYKKNIVYILSGSSSVNFKKTGEFLPGRRGGGKDFVFRPISFAEYVSLKFPEKREKIKKAITKQKNLNLIEQKIKTEINLKKEFDNYLITGGIPKIINIFEKYKKIPINQFQSYLSWIKSEIAKNQKDEYYVKIILERILQSLSFDLSYNSIAQDSGIGSHNTIYSYLNFLEDSFVIEQLYNYDFLQKKVQKKKNKKIYFNDPFVFWLISFWLGTGEALDIKNDNTSITKSKLVENVVAVFLKKKFGEKVYFYQSKYEIDFVIEKTAYEVKYQNKIFTDDIKKIKKFPNKKIILSKRTLEKKSGVQIIPVELFLFLDDLMR